MTKLRTKKGKVIRVDRGRQHQEKNQVWYDYPVVNEKTGRKLSYPLGSYFNTWEEYLEYSKFSI